VYKGQGQGDLSMALQQMESRVEAVATVAGAKEGLEE